MGEYGCVVSLVICDQIVDLGCVGIGGNYDDFKRAEANARRIVACVNACADVPTDMLKPGLVREMTETMDILLHIIYQFDRHHVFQRMFATSLEDAGEYVAKLRGEA